MIPLNTIKFGMVCILAPFTVIIPVYAYFKLKDRIKMNKMESY
jgi:hypothetical protein